MGIFSCLIWWSRVSWGLDQMFHDSLLRPCYFCINSNQRYCQSSTFFKDKVFTAWALLLHCVSFEMMLYSTMLSLLCRSSSKASDEVDLSSSTFYMKYTVLIYEELQSSLWQLALIIDQTIRPSLSTRWQPCVCWQSNHQYKWQSKFLVKTGEVFAHLLLQHRERKQSGVLCPTPIHPTPTYLHWDIVYIII